MCEGKTIIEMLFFHRTIVCRGNEHFVAKSLKHCIWLYSRFLNVLLGLD